MFSTSCSECTILDRMIWRGSRGRAAQSQSCSASRSSGSHRILGRAAAQQCCGHCGGPSLTVWRAAGTPSSSPGFLAVSHWQRSVRVSGCRSNSRQTKPPPVFAPPPALPGNHTWRSRPSPGLVCPVSLLTPVLLSEQCSPRRRRGEKAAGSGEKRSAGHYKFCLL